MTLIGEEWRIDVDAGIVFIFKPSSSGHNFKKNRKMFEDRNSASSETEFKVEINWKTHNAGTSETIHLNYLKILENLKIP